jgi:fatty-acyl-CoA synthase
VNEAKRAAAPATVHDLISDLALAAGDRRAVWTERTGWLTFAEVDEWSARFGAWLIGRGTRPGDRVAVLSENRVEWIIAAVAAMRIGATVVALNTWHRRFELADVLGRARPRVVVMAARSRSVDFVAELRPLLEQSGSPDVVALDDADVTFGATSFSVAAAGGDVGTEVRRPEPSSIAMILFSSGSTAFPKGVILRHRDLIANGRAMGERLRLTADDRVWVATPLFFAYSSANALFTSWARGASVVLQDRFVGGEALDLMERAACTAMYALPSMVVDLDREDRARPRKLSALRTGTTIGPPGIVEAAMRLAPELCNGYGLTETYGNCCATECTDEPRLRATSQGKPLSGHEVRVVRPGTLSPVPTGERGEIEVRGRVAQGYWQDPLQTARAFTRDGWFRTGDVGSLDGDRNLFFLGRSREIVKVRGITVAPVEVETVLLQHPAIADAHVVGLTDGDGSTGDEVLGAVVVLRDGEEPITPTEVIAHCREWCARYKVPARVIVVRSDDLPLTPTGKVLKAALRGWFR